MDAKFPTVIAGATPALTSNELAQDRTDFALERTRLAHERTMMAWIRTATSMISFGFGIYKFFDYFAGQKGVTQGLIGPRQFAIFLIGTALLILAAASVQNWSENRRLRAIGHVPRSIATAVAVLISILGILAMFAVILRQ